MQKLNQEALELGNWKWDGSSLVYLQDNCVVYRIEKHRFKENDWFHLQIKNWFTEIDGIHFKEMWKHITGKDL